MPSIDVRHLGDYIREQRATSQISLRQLAKLAGVSNPYLSQIERGLRKPSAEILQQIAKGLRISAEVLYVQAGILEQREAGGLVLDAVLSDEALTERQKQVLVEIYDSFRKENAASAALVLEAAPAVIVAAEGSAAKAAPTAKVRTAKAPTAKAATAKAATAKARTPRTPQPAKAKGAEATARTLPSA